MNDFIREVTRKVKHRCPRIIFPEGEDDRVIDAALKLQEEGVIQPILLGSHRVITEKMRLRQSDTPLSIIEINDQQTAPLFNDARMLLQHRHTSGEIKHLIQQPNYFAIMLLKQGAADGFVGGAVYKTADIIKPALHMIGVAPDVQRLSSYFIMIKEEKLFFFADCAVNVLPTSDELFEIASLTAQSALGLGVCPKVAFLSYSTKQSAVSPQSNTVLEAYQRFVDTHSEWPVDGEIQLDAAIIPEVSQIKVPDSPLKGDANVLIFPNLESGNISYKIAQRLGDFTALGPVFQGLNKPVNDLSRGCSSDDIYSMAILTALQSLPTNTVQEI